MSLSSLWQSVEPWLISDHYLTSLFYIQLYSRKLFKTILTWIWLLHSTNQQIDIHTMLHVLYTVINNLLLIVRCLFVAHETVRCITGGVNWDTGSVYIKQASAVNHQPLQILHALQQSLRISINHLMVTQLSASFLRAMAKMDDKMQMMELTWWGQFRSLSADATHKIHSKL